MSDLIQKIAEDLRGTCQSLQDACEHQDTNEDDLSIEQLQELDDIVFCCENCSWWCEICESSESDSQVCIDCANE